jgi:hypothetical protein
MQCLPTHRLTPGKLFISIFASFSICGILQIDLARIPDAAYPFVVLVIGLENMLVVSRLTIRRVTLSNLS